MGRERITELEFRLRQRKNRRRGMSRERNIAPGRNYGGEPSQGKTRRGDSEDAHIDESRGEIRSRFKGAKRRSSLPARLGDEKEMRQTDAIESPRTARKRASTRASQSSRDSDRSKKRTADIIRTFGTQYASTNRRDLPPCLRQTLPRATIPPPFSLRYYPSMMPDEKQRADMDRVADAMLTMQGGKVGNVAIDRIKFAARAVFALRGFGGFEARWGAGAYGRDPNERMGRLSAYGEEEALASGVRCLIANRMAYCLSTLEICTYCTGEEAKKTATRADLSPATTEEMENRFLPDSDMEPAGRYPYALDFSRRTIGNQNLVWSLMFGAGNYPEKEAASDFPILENESEPAFFCVPF